MKIIECDNKKMKQKLKRMIPKTYEILKRKYNELKYSTYTNEKEKVILKCVNVNI